MSGALTPSSSASPVAVVGSPRSAAASASSSAVATSPSFLYRGVHLQSQDDGSPTAAISPMLGTRPLVLSSNTEPSDLDASHAQYRETDAAMRRQLRRASTAKARAEFTLAAPLPVAPSAVINHLADPADLLLVASSAPLSPSSRALTAAAESRTMDDITRSMAAAFDAIDLAQRAMEYEAMEQ